MGPAAVRGGGSPPHATPFAHLSATERREMLLTDFCNRHVARAPLGSFDPRGDRRAFAPLATSDGAEPQRTSRVTTCLTARHELQPSSFTRLARHRPCSRCSTKVRMPSDPAGLPIVVEPARWHPPSPALSSVDGPNMTAFDAPVATRVRRSAARAARTAFPAASSKATARTTQGAFHRRVPRSTDPLARPGLERETRHRSRDFAAPVRLPALLRPPLPREEGLDPAASGRSSRPGAHGHAPLVDFCNRNDPQARPSDLRNPTRESGRAAFAALPISGAGPARGRDVGV